MTAERMLELRAAARSGMKVQDICRQYRVSDHTLRKYGILEPLDGTRRGRRIKAVPAEDLERAAEMFANGVSFSEVRRTTGIAWSRLKKLMAERGLQLLPPEERAERDRAKILKQLADGRRKQREQGLWRKKKPIEKEASHGGRLIARQNQPPEWAPKEDTTDLERAVTRLRHKYKPVCAENTIRHPYDAPPPYSADTLFRVGRHQNVPARKLMEMARHA